MGNNQHVSEENKVTIRLVTIAIVIGLIIVIVPALGYFYFSKNKSEPQKQIETKVNPFTTMVGSDTGEQYLVANLEASQDLMEKELAVLKDSNYSKYLKSYAVYLQSKISLNISSYKMPKEDRDNSYISIYNEIYDVYNNLDNNTTTNNLTDADKKYVRSRYFYLMNYLYNNANTSTFVDSKWAGTTEYKIIKNKYKEDRMARSFFMLQMSEATLDEKDKLQIAINLHILTKILNIHSSQLETDTLNLLLNDLKNKQEMYKKAGDTIMFSSAQYKYIIPSRYQVESYALLAHFDKKINDKEIRQIFQNAFDEFPKYAKSDKDVIYSTKLFNQFTYISYLYEMNDNKVNNEINDILKTIISYHDSLANNSKPEILNVFTNYIQGFSKADQNDIFRSNILSVSQKNDDFKRFLLKTGTAK